MSEKDGGGAASEAAAAEPRDGGSGVDGGSRGTWGSRPNGIFHSEPAAADAGASVDQVTSSNRVCISGSRIHIESVWARSRGFFAELRVALGL